jgi:hypothetical protein
MSTLPVIIPTEDHMFRYLIQCIVMINQTWRLTSVHSQRVKMATELHHTEGRIGPVASLPEVPGICHVPHCM